MSPAELEAYEKTTAAILARAAAMQEDVARIVTESDAMQRAHEARMERSMQRGARQTYQTEIHGVAINVLVSILTKDALRGIRESEFAESAKKLDIAETVDFSLMVAKRYVDELHRIGVSEKQVEEYKEVFREHVEQNHPSVALAPLK